MDRYDRYTLIRWIDRWIAPPTPRGSFSLSESLNKSPQLFFLTSMIFFRNLLPGRSGDESFDLPVAVAVSVTLEIQQTDNESSLDDCIPCSGIGVPLESQTPLVVVVVLVVEVVAEVV